MNLYIRTLHSELNLQIQQDLHRTSQYHQSPHHLEYIHLYVSIQQLYILFFPLMPAPPYDALDSFR